MEMDIRKLCFHCFQEKADPAAMCPHCGFTPPVQTQYPLALPAGSVLAGRYLVGRVLGQGGFGITYVALDVKTKMRVAVKEYMPETMATRQMGNQQVTAFSGAQSENFTYGKEQFLEEARTLARFSGVNGIVSVHSYFEENNTAYFAMEYVDGISFKNLIKQSGGKVTWSVARSVLVPVMEALGAVHQEGIIHRDVTPDNIYINKEGAVKLLDFGAARYSIGDRSRSLDVVLKAGYAPKEQYVRRGRQGPFTDVYSVAASFYASLTGFLPPESLERMEDDNLVLPSARGVSLPPAAEDAIEMGLAVKAEDRFQSMIAFKEAIMNADPTPLLPIFPGAKPPMEAGAGQGRYIEFTPQPVPQPVPQPAPQPVPQPVPQPAPQPAPQPVPQPAPQPVPQPAPQPVPQPTPQPVPQPAPKKKTGLFVGIGVSVLILLVLLGVLLFMLFSGNDSKPSGSGGGGGYTPPVSSQTTSLSTETQTIPYDNGDVYEGETFNGVPQGEGVYTWANGCKYEGNFAGGYPYGSGTFTYLDGTKKTSTDWAHAEKEEYTYSGGEYEGQLACYYTGMMINNEAYGYGSFKWTENDPFCPGWTYSGEMNEDDANGYGVLNFNIANTKYEGYVAAGYPSGFGVYTDSTGGIQEADNWLWIGGTAEFSEQYGEKGDFEGMSIDGVWNGMGHITVGDGNYWGEFRENAIYGAGKFIYSNGEELFGEKWTVELIDGVGYSGMMLDGVKAGYGVRTTKEGYKYAGEYVNDMKHGFGVFDTPEGDHYEGFWANDVRHGKGVYTWGDSGNVYDGDFLEGKRTGKATMLFAKTGDVYEGDFVDGKRHGTGTHTWNSGDKKGDKYVGDWVEGERTGFGIYYYADGTSKSGQWEKGKFIG